jgi:hypothetical protein
MRPRSPPSKWTHNQQKAKAAIVGGVSQPSTALRASEKHQNNTNRGSFNNNNKRNDTNHNHSFPTLPATENVPRNFDDASSRTDDATAPSTAFAANTQQLTMKRRNNGGLAFATAVSQDPRLSSHERDVNPLVRPKTKSLAQACKTSA